MQAFYKNSFKNLTWKRSFVLVWDVLWFDFATTTNKEIADIMWETCLSVLRWSMIAFFYQSCKMLLNECIQNLTFFLLHSIRPRKTNTNVTPITLSLVFLVNWKESIAILQYISLKFQMYQFQVTGTSSNGFVYFISLDFLFAIHAVFIPV